MNRFTTEIASLLKLALPVALAQLAVVGMSATDVLMAGQAGTLELAGMNLGVNTWNMVIMFFMGVGFATQPLVAKYFGAQDELAVKHQLHQSIWMCLGLGLLATLVVLLCAWLIQLAEFDVGMLQVATQYLLAISLCAIPMVVMPALRGALEGMNFTRVVFIVYLSAFLLNIPLDYVLVHGLFGMPTLGGVGCAWATVTLVWLMLFASFAVLKWHSQLKAKGLLSDFQSPNYKTILKTLKIGLPMGLSITIELSMFSGAGMLIAWFGPTEVSAHAVAITVAAMSFMLYMGLGQGVTIRASQFIGACEADRAAYTIKVGTVFNLVIAVLVCVGYLVWNESIIRLFSEDPDVIVLAVVLLYFGAAFQLADSLQVAVVCALRAYHDTSSPPKYQFVAFILFGLPIGVGLSFYGWVPGLEGARGMWMAMVVSLFIVGVLLLMRLRVKMREFHQDLVR